MKKDAATTPSRSRSRKKAAPPAVASAPTESASAEVAAEPGTAGVNVGPLEGSLSVTAGVLLIVAALFPRSLRQLLLLGLGGAFIYRGTTRHCSVYSALDLDTAKEPLLKQINDKYLAPATDGDAAS